MSAAHRDFHAGVIMAFVLVALAVLSMAVATIMQQLAQELRQVQQHERQLQAMHILDVVTHQAIDRYRTDPSLRNATWRFPCHTARATIDAQAYYAVHVEVNAKPETVLPVVGASDDVPTDGQSPAKLQQRGERTQPSWIEIEIHYPADSARAIRRVRRIPIPAITPSVDATPATQTAPAPVITPATNGEN